MAMIKRILPRLTVLVALSWASCSREQGQNGIVIVAIEGDVDSFNPLFAEEVIAGEIGDLLYPALVGSDFDSSRGKLTYTPLLAHSWEFSPSGRDVTFHLVWGASWSDGAPITANDVQLSYQLYADSTVASVRQAAVENLERFDGVQDISRSVEVVDDSTVVFHFESRSAGHLFDAGLPVLPAHVFGRIPRGELRTLRMDKDLVVSGPFLLQRWIPLQEIVLVPNPASRLPYPAKISQLVFRVIPEHASRVAQLKSGDVHLVAGLRPEDAAEIEANNPALAIISTPGRDYDFLGWNNIDPEAFGSSDGKAIRPHPLFGSATVRRALTMAINRDEIAKSFLGDHGRQAFGGVSPLFRWAFNDTLRPLPYDPQRALALLREEGWRDSNRDGILDRNGKNFSFTLHIPSGNQLRGVVATVVQQQLRNVNIEMKIEQVERGTFWDNLMGRRYDAWFAGFTVPLQMQLDDLWGSDLEKYPFNLTGFRSARVDEILASCRTLTNEADGGPLWKEFQVIAHQQQPCTFLFWINNIVGMNRRINDANIGVLGTTHKAWEWTVAEPQ